MLLVEYQCPQCGAPATLEETDRLVCCRFCRVTSYLVDNDCFRYVLPHKRPDQEMLYFPYWRFRGTFYSCVTGGVRHRFVDTSMQGVVSRNFPSSVGVRSQAMRLRFATPETAGRFVVPEGNARDATRVLAERLCASVPRPIFHQEFIGESMSLIYSPFYLNGKVFDAVVDKATSPVLPDDFAATLTTAEQSGSDVQFIAAMCPHCGWDLEGERDALVLYCKNCSAAWRSTPQGLTRVEFAHMAGDDETVLFLPFWRMAVDLAGIELASFADLVKVGNLPKVIQEGWDEQKIHFAGRDARVVLAAAGRPSGEPAALGSDRERQGRAGALHAATRAYVPAAA